RTGRRRLFSPSSEVTLESTYHSPPNTKLGDTAEPRTAAEPRIDLAGAPTVRLTTRVRLFLRQHGRKLWWLHSAYALAIGAGVVLFAQRGFEHARWLAVALGLACLLVVLVFRLFGSGDQHRAFETAQAGLGRQGTKTRVHFYVMTYALKNLYQWMLFFLLPFYWKSATAGAHNVWFVLLLGA